MPVRKVTDPSVLAQLNQGGNVVAPNPMFPGQMQAQTLNNDEKRATLPYAAPRAAAETAAAQADARIKGVNAGYAPAVTQAELDKTRAEADKARAELERTRLDQPSVKQSQSAEALMKAAGVDLAKGIDPIEALITGSTSGRVQHLGAEAYGSISGHATPGMENIAKLQTLMSDMTLQLSNGSLGTGFSNADRDFMVQRVGNLADPNVPADQRLAAWQQVKQRMANILGVQMPSGNRRDLTPEQKDQFFSILQKDGADKADAYLRQYGLSMQDKSAATRPYAKQIVKAQPDSYQNSYASQALSGANEGLASVLGAPVDLVRGAINLVPQGINAVANTNIPTLPEPVAGGDWWKRRLTELGSIQAPSDDPSKQFVRRVGESVGSSVVPAGFAGSLGKVGAGLLSGLGGGLGAATAQQVAPNNPLAELGGEMLGGGLSGGSLLKNAQRQATRKLEDKIPTIADLQDTASQLYQAAEANGVTASPTQTRQLAAAMRQTLKREGQLGPRGKITNADTNTSKAFNLINQYAGKQMKPSEMNTVRKVLADSRKSSDPSDKRLGSILLDQFDNFARPLAPEFDQARSVASRYLQAQDLERARELAAARASQFSGSGFENALRTEYRALDRGAINGNQYFSPEVNDAVEKVARGTPGSNFARSLGKLAPTGVVSGGLGSFLPGFGVASVFGGPAGAATGATLASLGVGGRVAATRMGIRAADEAELIARNGGKLPKAAFLPRSLGDYVAYLSAAQAPKYIDVLNEQ